MFAVVYCRQALATALFDPEVGIDFAMLVHGGQEFHWGELVLAGDEIEHRDLGQDIPESAGLALLCVRVGLAQSARRRGLPRAVDEHRQGRVMTLEPGTQIELRVTPDPYVTIRYAGASGDFNPIHIDEEFAREVGLPHRILHGLWTMAQVARAHTEAAGGPEALRSLASSSGAWVRSARRSSCPAPSARVEDGVATVTSEATQNGQRIIRNARAQLRVSRER